MDVLFKKAIFQLDADLIMSPEKREDGKGYPYQA